MHWKERLGQSSYGVLLYVWENLLSNAPDGQGYEKGLLLICAYLCDNCVFPGE
jgi:hypothetical protein